MPDASFESPRPLIVGERVEIRPGRFISVTRHVGRAEEDRVLFFCHGSGGNQDQWREQWRILAAEGFHLVALDLLGHGASEDRKSTRLNSSHTVISYAVFCLK